MGKDTPCKKVKISKLKCYQISDKTDFKTKHALEIKSFCNNKIINL